MVRLYGYHVYVQRTYDYYIELYKNTIIFLDMDMDNTAVFMRLSK